MYRSWGYATTIATVSVAASGMVTVGTKLVLPGDRRHAVVRHGPPDR